MAVLLLLHTPPLTAAVKVTALPAHRLSAPVIVPAVAGARTTRLKVAATVPQLLVTV